MDLWTQGVDVLREAIFAYSQVTNGNIGYGIIIVTLLVRLAVFPLTLKLARHAAVQQRAMQRVAPQLEAIRARFRGDPTRAADETRQVLAREGISMFPQAGCIGLAVQAPLFLAMFDAVRQASALGGRFLWMRDIARPDIGIALAVGALTAASMVAGPQAELSAQQRALMLVMPAVLTVVALWQMAAGVGLYWGVSSVVGVAQGFLVRYQRRT